MRCAHSSAGPATYAAISLSDLILRWGGQREVAAIAKLVPELGWNSAFALDALCPLFGGPGNVCGDLAFRSHTPLGRPTRGSRDREARPRARVELGVRARCVVPTLRRARQRMRRSRFPISYSAGAANER